MLVQHHRRPPGRRGGRLGDLLDLLLHVLDDHVEQGALRGAIADRLARVVDVHVHLDQARVPHHQRRVAHRVDRVADQRYVQVPTLDDELDVIVVHLVPGVRQRRRHRRLGRRLGDHLDRLPPQIAHHALQDQRQSAAAGVHHPRVRQHLEQPRRLLDGLMATVDHLGQHHAQILLRLRRDLGCLGRLADDGQDRPLDRLDHPLVGRLGGLAHRDRELPGIKRRQVLQLAGEPAPDLRQDHPRVAAGAHQGAVRDPLRYPADVVQLLRGHLVVGRAHREEHVGAGIAIGNRKDVEGVDRLVMAIEPGQAGLQQPFQPLSFTICHDRLRPAKA